MTNRTSLSGTARGRAMPPKPKGVVTSRSVAFRLFVMLAAVSVAIWWNSLSSTFALAWRDERYTHILLILPLSASLIYLEWKSLESLPQSRANSGYVLLVAAVVATVVTRLRTFPLQADERLALNMLALVVWWIGAFLVSFGTRAFERLLFPLCFLLWIVPLPTFVLNPIVRLLQEGSVASARWLFSAFGVPVAQHGAIIAVPGLTVEVAPECSSIRSSLMLVVTTMVLAQVTLRTAWRKAVISAVAIPLSVAKNGLRIFLLGLLITRVDPSFMTGRLHHQGGIIYFLIALALIIVLIWMARFGEKKSRVLVASSPGLAETDPQSP